MKYRKSEEIVGQVLILIHFVFIQVFCCWFRYNDTSQNKKKKQPTNDLEDQTSRTEEVQKFVDADAANHGMDWSKWIKRS